MTLEQIKEQNITNAEMQRIGLYEDGLSDFCEMTDGTWGIEWDGIYGRHWERFPSKYEAELALRRKDEREFELLARVRRELAQEAVEAKEEAKAADAKRREIREAKTLGGQHPVLKQLLKKVR
jgi:hypothetical protein